MGTVQAIIMIQKNKTQSFGRLPMCSSGYEIRISMQQQREERRGLFEGRSGETGEYSRTIRLAFGMYRQPRLNSPGKYFAFFWPLFRFARYGRVCVISLETYIFY